MLNFSNAQEPQGGGNMDNFIIKKVNDDTPYLMHYGVKGMKWGVRRRGENETARSQKKRIP